VVLGFIGAMHGARVDDTLRVHLSLGRIVDGLARKCDRLVLSVPIQDNRDDKTRDYTLQSKNIDVIEQPIYHSSQAALKHAPKIIISYWKTVSRCDRVVIRGMVPLVEWIYLACIVFRKRPVHWLVGNPQALLDSHDRTGGIRDTAYKLFADGQSLATRIGRRLTNGWLMCNGEELGSLYDSPRTKIVVSSTVTSDEFQWRYTACQDSSRLKVLFVGFLRPEKGLQYLMEGLAELPRDIAWHLKIVGTFGAFTDYKKDILSLVSELDLADRIEWAGYVPYGVELRNMLAESDILILPSLSEGTPRILIEARANGLPVIASNVGGIPTSVTDGCDGLLVPAKNTKAISSAIVKLHSNPEYALKLVEEGYKTSAKWTVESFIGILYDACMEGLDAKSE
jgi:glycosyltransferase involved in cell wall biosynthesis